MNPTEVLFFHNIFLNFFVSANICPGAWGSGSALPVKCSIDCILQAKKSPLSFFLMRGGIENGFGFTKRLICEEKRITALSYRLHKQVRQNGRCCRLCRSLNEQRKWYIREMCFFRRKELQKEFDSDISDLIGSRIP